MLLLLFPLGRELRKCKFAIFIFISSCEDFENLARFMLLLLFPLGRELRKCKFAIFVLIKILDNFFGFVISIWGTCLFLLLLLRLLSFICLLHVFCLLPFLS